MSIGYDNMSLDDFEQYTAGSYTFHYDEGRAKVHAYIHEGVTGDGGCDEARDGYAYLRPVTGGNQDYVSIATLIDSPYWILHRFPSGYVAIKEGATLLRIALEPSARRMRKGTDLGYLRGRCIINNVDKTVPPALADALGPFCRTYDASRSVLEQDIILGLCEQLILGHTPAFRRVPMPDAEVRSKAAVRNLLLWRDHKRWCLAVTPEIALVRGAGPVAYVLYSGIVMGVVALSKERLILTSDALTDIPRGALRTSARASYTELLTKTICDAIDWRY